MRMSKRDCWAVYEWGNVYLYDARELLLNTNALMPCVSAHVWVGVVKSVKRNVNPSSLCYWIFKKWTDESCRNMSQCLVALSFMPVQSQSGNNDLSLLCWLCSSWDWLSNELWSQRWPVELNNHNLAAAVVEIMQWEIRSYRKKKCGEKK